MAHDETFKQKIIAVFNQKGGCGKTMTTMQLAGALGIQGYKVMVLDMDPQNTAYTWWSLADPVNEPFPAEMLSYAPMKEAFTQKLGMLTKHKDVVIIDCPPALDSNVPWAALLMADLAIIPVIPVMDNIWATKQAEELAHKAQQENPALNVRYLFSNVKRGRITDLCLEELAANATFPRFETKLASRNVYPECQPFGYSVHGFGKSQAVAEVNALASEVCAVLNI